MTWGETTHSRRTSGRLRIGFWGPHTCSSLGDSALSSFWGVGLSSWIWVSLWVPGALVLGASVQGSPARPPSLWSLQSPTWSQGRWACPVGAVCSAHPEGPPTWPGPSFPLLSNPSCPRLVLKPAAPRPCTKPPQNSVAATTTVRLTSLRVRSQGMAGIAGGHA